MLTLKNDEEQRLWQAMLVAFVSKGGYTEKGAHLQFADRAVQAYRKRLPGKTPVESLVERYCPQHMTLKEFAKSVAEACDKSYEKIPAIKIVREMTRLGLREAKEAVEAYDSVYPNQTWRRYR